MWLRVSDDDKRQRLLQAIEEDDVTTVRELLEKGNMDLNMRDEEGRTPLHWAISHGQLQVVAFLLKTGADPNRADKNGASSLHWASSDQIGSSPVQWASREGRLDILKLLLKFSKDPNAATTNGETPLHEASRKGHTQVVEILLRAGANSNAANRDQQTALHLASSRGQLQVVELLLMTKTDLSARDTYEETPLHKASRKGHVHVVEMLLEANADPRAVDKDGRSALHLAAFEGHLQVVEFLLFRSDSNATDTVRWISTIMSCCIRTKVSDPNATDKNGETALHKASNSGQIDVVQLLLNSNANPSASNKEGVTPLHLASLWHHVEVANLLLKANADPDAADEHGETPLLVAAREGYLGVVKMLLMANANANATDELGQTSLHVACHFHKGQIAQVLLEAGADLHVKDNDGYEPLHLCIQVNHEPSDGEDVQVNRETLLTLQSLMSFGAAWDTTCDEIVTSGMAWKEAPALRLCVLLWTKERADGVVFTDVPNDVIRHGATSTQAFIEKFKTSREIVMPHKVAIAGPRSFGKASLIQSITSKRTQLEYVGDRTMSIRALAEPVIGDTTVFEVLSRIYDLTNNPRHGRTTYFELHGQLQFISEALQAIELHGGLHSKVVDKFAKTLEEYWRHLEAYQAMNFVERLLYHGKMRIAIERINTNVDEIVGMVGVASSRVMADWRKQYVADMAEQHRQLVAIATNSSEVLDELRDAKEQRDAAVLLRAALDKIDSGKSSLPEDVHAAVRKAYMAITYRDHSLIQPTPEWFLDENDVDFDEVPFARESFATVHRGTLNVFTRVVVKMLLPGEGGLDRTLQDAFENEVGIWRMLHHPHVARLVGACHVSSRPFIVCEDATNGSMAEYLSRSTDRRVMWRLLYEAAQGLSHLHSKGIVYGDLRLANILVTEAKTALIADIGLSRLKEKSSSPSKSTTARKDSEPPVVGTSRWMAPECFDQRPQYASDVYALAMCIHEAFIGEPPYADVRDDEDIKAKIMSGELPSRSPSMSNKVWMLIETMTRMDPKKRTPLSEVIQRLGEFAESEAAPPSSEDETVIAGDTRVVTLDLLPLVNELQRDEVSAAEQLSNLSNDPETAMQLLSSSIIHKLITALQDSSSVHLQEHVASVLSNVARQQHGATVIGSRGGILPLVELLASTHEQLRRAGLQALTPLLKDPMNACMFCHARGVEALATHLAGDSGVEALEHLELILLSASSELTEALAANEPIARLCLNHVASGQAGEQRDAAVRVLRELAKHARAVLVIDRLGGFVTLQGSQHSDMLMVAIKTMLRRAYGDDAATQRADVPLVGREGHCV